MNPQTYVVGAVGLSTILVAGSAMASGSMPKVRVFIGGTLAAFTLSLLAGPLPGLAKGLATLAILTTAMTSGYALVQALTKLVA